MISLAISALRAAWDDGFWPGIVVGFAVGLWLANFVRWVL